MILDPHVQQLMGNHKILEPAILIHQVVGQGDDTLR